MKIIDSSIQDVYPFYAWLRTRTANTALLESLGSADELVTRYSIVGAVPREVLVSTNGQARLEDLATGSTTAVDDWLEILSAWCPIQADSPQADPYQLGAIGYVGYEEMLKFSPQPPAPKTDSTLPWMRMVRYDALLVHDQRDGSSKWVAVDECVDHVRALEAAYLAGGMAVPEAEFHLSGDLACDTDGPNYREGVRRIVDYIRNGDIFQANYTVRFSGAYEGDMFRLYHVLRSVTPNAFFTFLDFPCPVISTSPERFFSIAGRQIASYPIKGTIRCTIDGQDQRETLVRSEKNRAENIMIADLMRNDLGMVSEKGSIRVPMLCRVRQCNTIYHLESVVEGQLRPQVGLREVLEAVCPGGSITGAPKVRAMQVIGELETSSRGPYCGAIGFFGARGYVDTSIAIRVVYGDGQRLFLHAGGGIVVDSDCDDEYREMQLKSEALRQVIGRFNVLNTVRAHLDETDTAIFDLVARRMQLAREVARLKKKHRISPLQPNRVADMVRRRERQLEEAGVPPGAMVSQLYEVLVRSSMDIQQEWLNASEDKHPINESTHP